MSLAQLELMRVAKATSPGKLSDRALTEGQRDQSPEKRSNITPNLIPAGRVSRRARKPLPV